MKPKDPALRYCGTKRSLYGIGLSGRLAVAISLSTLLACTPNTEERERDALKRLQVSANPHDPSPNQKLSVPPFFSATQLKEGLQWEYHRISLPAKKPSGEAKESGESLKPALDSEGPDSSSLLTNDQIEADSVQDRCDRFIVSKIQDGLVKLTVRYSLTCDAKFVESEYREIWFLAETGEIKRDLTYLDGQPANNDTAGNILPLFNFSKVEAAVKKIAKIQIGGKDYKAFSIGKTDKIFFDEGESPFHTLVLRWKVQDKTGKRSYLYEIRELIPVQTQQKPAAPGESESVTIPVIN